MAETEALWQEFLAERLAVKLPVVDVPFPFPPGPIIKPGPGFIEHPIQPGPPIEPGPIIQPGPGQPGIGLWSLWPFLLPERTVNIGGSGVTTK